MVISAFPACGKSFYYSIFDDVLDSDSSLFSWIKEDGEKIRNPEFPQNYFEHIKQNYHNKNLDYIFVPGIKKAVEEKASVIKAYVVGNGQKKEFELTLGELTDEERQIILKGCLINYNRV